MDSQSALLLDYCIVTDPDLIRENVRRTWGTDDLTPSELESSIKTARKAKKLLAEQINACQPATR